MAFFIHIVGGRVHTLYQRVSNTQKVSTSYLLEVSPIEDFSVITISENIASTSYPVVVGAGSSTVGANSRPPNGSNSTFGPFSSTGGGAGGHESSRNGSPGGSGGGAGYGSCLAGGVGNTPPVSPSQGFPGGTGKGSSGGAGGGGATVVGGNPAHPGCGKGGAGGNGATTSINATPTARSGGGSGSSDSTPVAGGTGGGGTGHGGPPGTGTAGTTNTGGGGGGSRCNPGGAGGSGVVIIRYKFQ